MLKDYTKVPILRNGRPAASLRGTVLERSVKGSKHFLRQGIAFAENTITRAIELGAETVEVTDRETGDIYTTPIHRFATDGWKLDWGYGKQVALDFAHWHKEADPQQPQLF